MKSKYKITEDKIEVFFDGSSITKRDGTAIIDEAHLKYPELPFDEEILQEPPQPEIKKKNDH